ncbi:hypothetical protein ACXYMX_16640 [Sporosarcina sp. CAU 1771]
MKRTVYLLGALLLSLLLLSGCIKIGTPAEKAVEVDKVDEVVEVLETDKEEPVDVEEASEAVDFEGMMEREREVEDFPEWLPQPDGFIVIMDMDGGPMRAVVLEAEEADIPAMVARFNEELSAIGADGLLEEEMDEETNLYSAFGQISYGDDLVMISIGEYEPDGALVEGNTGSVSYQIF